MTVTLSVVASQEFSFLSCPEAEIPEPGFLGAQSLWMIRYHTSLPKLPTHRER